MKEGWKEVVDQDLLKYISTDREVQIEIKNRRKNLKLIDNFCASNTM